MTAVFAALELYPALPEEDDAAIAQELAEHVPVGAQRVAAAHPTGAKQAFSWIWKGIKAVAGAAWQFMTIGVLTLTVFLWGRALWKEIDSVEPARAGEGARVLIFPRGPHLAEDLL